MILDSEISNINPTLHKADVSLAKYSTKEITNNQNDAKSSSNGIGVKIIGKIDVSKF